MNRARKKTGNKIELVHGSGNAFHDLGMHDAEAKHLKAVLAAEIIKTLDRQGLTVRKAHASTGIAAADFSRIRQVKLERFTLDRLMNILSRLDQKVVVTVKVRPSYASPRAQAV